MLNEPNNPLVFSIAVVEPKSSHSDDSLLLKCSIAGWLFGTFQFSVISLVDEAIGHLISEQLLVFALFLSPTITVAALFLTPIRPLYRLLAFLLSLGLLLAQCVAIGILYFVFHGFEGIH